MDIKRLCLLRKLKETATIIDGWDSSRQWKRRADSAVVPDTLLFQVRKNTVEIQGVYAEVTMEKQEWKSRVKEQVKQILKYKPEAVFVGENLFAAYPIVHALRKKHIPVLVLAEKDGQKLIVRIPSGS